MTDALNNAREEVPQTPDAAADDERVWGRSFSLFDVFARNISMDYFGLGLEMVVGVVMLPFNIAHLGQSAYGLWVLAASITAYFSMLDLGYGVAQVKFAAQYRARRDHRGLNEIVSTLFFFFTLVGLAAMGVGALLAFNLERLFNVTPDQAAVGRKVLLIITAYVAVGFPFSVFGGIVNGFQRHFMNGSVAIATVIAVAVANVAVLLAGYGLVELVVTTTTIRMLAYIGYRLNAYRAFPGLKIRPGFVKLTRLREVTGFSAFILLIDIANKVNYSTDTVVIGAFMGTVAIAVWAVAQRLITTVQNMTSQLSGSLFPIIVDFATLDDGERLRRVFVQGTRITLAMVLPMTAGLVLLAEPLVQAWVGPNFQASVTIIYMLAAAIAVRVATSPASMLLKGAGRHRLIAFVNLTIALTNLILSIVLVRWLGLMGVALGTLIPVTLGAGAVIFPAACRRVEMPLTKALGQAVWPALWPVAPMALMLAATRNLFGANLIYVGLQSAAAGLVYAAVFLLFAIRRDERQWYADKIRQLFGRKQAAAAEA
ncbi:MAG TPA: oligosaccharide flippase family protein [Blastocatellia bacterium]|nr:oligosaccharide flippase family protein [Blastocatellia bacterium]